MISAEDVSSRKDVLQSEDDDEESKESDIA